MRALTEEQRVVLGSELVLDSEDPSVPALHHGALQCVADGLAEERLYRVGDDVVLDFFVNDRGRCALRAHAAFLSSIGGVP